MTDQQTRLTIFVNPQDAKNLKQRAIREGTTLSEYLVTTSDYYNQNAVPLTPPTNKLPINNNIIGEVLYIGEVRAGSECWRIDIGFKETDSNKFLRSWYEIWASQEFIEDYLKTLPNEPLNKKDMLQFAYKIVSEEYSKSGNTIPDEYGVFCSHKTGIKKVKGRDELLSFYEKLTNE